LLSIKIRQIWSAIEEGEYSIAVYLFSNQAPLAEGDRERFISALQPHGIKLFQNDLYALSHGLVRAARPRRKKKLNPTSGHSYPVLDNGGRGYSLLVTLSEAFRFVTLPNGRDFDESLLDDNVRYFLGADNEVNKEIRDTLLRGESVDFWYLNNGITVICDQIIGMCNGCHPITLINPQIVNGGQTARVIFEVGASSLLSIGDGSLAVKIIETSDENLIKKIALSSNTQSRIYTRDLRANDHIQIKLEKALALRGYQYIRKRGMETSGSLGRAIDALRAGQIILSFICGEPTKSKTESGEIFGSLYGTVFDEHNLNVDTLVTAFECYETIDGMRRTAEILQRSSVKSHFE
ncbi:MAG: AIPR family protein, partial [Prosthecobacter sp.]|nr:AIPR family protein [Prosthecobacter sp.]